MTIMESTELRLVLFTPHLGKVQDFYTAVGMDWAGGHNPKINESFRPDSPAGPMGLPWLLGALGNVQFNFYFQQSIAPAPAPAVLSTVIFVRFLEAGEAARAV
jgi:hypothetical protein